LNRRLLTSSEQCQDPSKELRHPRERNPNQQSKNEIIDNAAPHASITSSDGAHQTLQTAMIMQAQDNMDKGHQPMFDIKEVTYDTHHQVITNPLTAATAATSGPHTSVPYVWNILSYRCGVIEA
jgi:hypothetical protein